MTRKILTAKAEPYFALTDGATINTDAARGNQFSVTLGGNRTLANPTNAVDGQKIIYRIKQDGTGGRTLTWGSNFRFSTSLPSPTLSTGASKVDYIGFVYNATDGKWDCLAQNIGF